MPREATACNIPGYRYWKPAGACLPVCNYKAGERHRRAFPFFCYTPQPGMVGGNRLKKVARLAPPRVAQPVAKKQKGIPKIEPSFYDLLYGSLPPRKPSAYRDCMKPKLLGQKGLGKDAYRTVFATAAKECGSGKTKTKSAGMLTFDKAVQGGKSKDVMVGDKFKARSTGKVYIKTHSDGRHKLA